MMEEEPYSWIRRTKFSHRFDSSRMAFANLAIDEVDRIPIPIPRLKTRPAPAGSAAFIQKSRPSNSKTQMNKQRSLSPQPQQSTLSEAFKEAKSDSKRFSTPHPKRKGMGRLFSKESHCKPSNSMDTSPLRHFAAMKAKNRKESPWAKYFDHSGGRVTAVDAADEFSVDLSKLLLGVKFAHGAHSRLYHGIYSDEAVAVKIISVPDDDDETGVLAARLEKQYRREATLLSRLHHSNVIKFIAACRKPPVYCVVTEYLSEGSLRAYLHKLEEKSLPLEKLIAIALDIARGMEYTHSQGVIHRDLKPENVLIDQDFHLKIGDFGIACEEACCDSLADDPGTLRWMAPEMIKRKSYGRKVDVYSFGLVLWEMVAGTIPYNDMNPVQAAFAVVNKNLRPAIPKHCPAAMRTLIDQCWSLHPEKRPEFCQIVKLLEQFESSLARDGTLNHVQTPACHDHKKGLLHRIQKLGPVHPHTPTPKPRLS